MYQIWQSTHRMVIRHDPHIGHRYVPNQRARIPNENGGSYVVTNSQGFRSDVDFRKEPTGRPRILFFGDSYTAGDLCNNNERFPERVGEALGAEVYNFGLSGSGTDQQYLAFRQYARDISTDLIVISVLAENIDRNKVSHRVTLDRTSGRKILLPKPFFSLDEKSCLQLQQVPVPLERPDAPEGVDADRFGSHQRRRVLGPLFRALDLYRSHPRLQSARRRLDALLGRLRPTLLRAVRFQPFPDYRSKGSPGWRLMEAILRQWLSEAAPTPVLIVPLPTYHNLRDDIEPIFQPFFESLSDPPRGVHVADVARPLCALPRAERLKITFQKDVHFSPNGHAVVAGLLQRQIRDRGLLPEASASRHPAGDAPPRSRPTVSTHDRRATYVLGISCFYHNSAAGLVADGRIVAAAEEERFSRVKNDRRFPAAAINYCLEEAGISPKDLALVVFYDQAPLTFERLLHSLAITGARGRSNWGRYIPSWALYKLQVPRLIRETLGYEGKILHDAHHRSHAASAFYPSPFEDAAILTVDGVGEWATASIGVGEATGVRLIKEMHFPDSLGLLYSAFTQFTGFKVNSGEYKMMGLAPYGKPQYVDVILEHLVDLKDDGSLELNLEYFAFLAEDRMTNDRFAELFGGPARKAEDWITEREMDIARSIQVVTEEAMLRMARHAHRLTGKSNLCMAGGVALNCVANGRLLREGPFERIWIQPAAGDSGGALGAAFDAYHSFLGRPRVRREDGRSIQGASCLGPAYNDDEIQAFLESQGHPAHRLGPEQRAERVAELLADGRVVGHFAGRLEFGPRALGARSILGDARNADMQATLNLKIKYRESFRPFAPSVLEEDVEQYFELEGESPYMLLVAPVQPCRRLAKPEREAGEDLTTVVRVPRSDIPAITHIDYSARVQTVSRIDHARYHRLISSFKEKTGYGLIVNTSFNVRGEPIICTPYDAYRCFMRTEMDALVLGNFLLLKAEQKPWPEKKGHVESDGVWRAPMDGGLARRTEDVFDKLFLPVATKLLESDRLKVDTGFRRSSSRWRDAQEPDNVGDLFEIPAALDGNGDSDAAQMASALVAGWTPRETAEALRPVVEELLRLGVAYGRGGELSEEVSDSVYVMF